jgi:hypothetical protein
MATKRARKTTKRGTTSKKTTKAAKKSGSRSTPNVALRMQLETVMTAIDKAPAATQGFAEIEDLRAALPPAIQVLKRNPGGAGQSEVTKGGG